VQNCGPRKLVDHAQWGKLGCLTTDFYAEYIICAPPSQGAIFKRNITERFQSGCPQMTLPLTSTWV